jgi:HEPN domain-containing protein
MISEHEKSFMAWIEKADSDLQAAHVIFDADVLILDIVCFHCQQAVEKYLKGFLVVHEIDFPRTHILEYLLQLCAAVDDDFNSFNVNELSQYAVRARYPHDSYAPEKTEVIYYLELSSQVRKMVIEKIDFQISYINHLLLN